MPLTAALQARLKRRGIVAKAVEEPKKDGQTSSQNEPVKGCPNRTNPHHECVEYCRTRWGNIDPTQAPHIKDYSHVPLPPGWYFVPDYSNGKHYYWNTTTNQVSWLHPLDPVADITIPASVVNKQNKDSDIEPNREIPSPYISTTGEGTQELSIGRHPSLMKGSQKRQEAAEKRKLNEKETKNKRGRSDELDPMDPAAYSDTPRGDWSSGLSQKGEAKTGVDVTATGPLFQQRPYPSPGDILRQNMKLSSGGE
ncbi:polyglutamine-binding protein 1 [Exaiptasia diaphana]|uniref:Polyglutamine-binding protein 1 n=1 Tax=Exaiptasia diaphana TaxID=2652724 RepID=A0A913YJE5_EXADI|nr:polyglutamine-binding protein 1 [Exaiptasia diaphana]